VNQQLPARVIVEAGVWRGGASILAAAVLQEALDAQRQRAAVAVASTSAAPLTQTWTVALCDSFRGLPLNSSEADTDWWHSQRQLKVGDWERVSLPIILVARNNLSNLLSFLSSNKREYRQDKGS